MPGTGKELGQVGACGRVACPKVPAPQFCAGGRTFRARTRRSDYSSNVICPAPPLCSSPPGQSPPSRRVRVQHCTLGGLCKLCGRRANKQRRWHTSQQSTLSSGTCASGAQFRHLLLCLREGLVKLRGLFGLLQLFSSRHHRLSVLNVMPGPKPLPHPVCWRQPLLSWVTNNFFGFLPCPLSPRCYFAVPSTAWQLQF